MKCPRCHVLATDADMSRSPRVYMGASNIAGYTFDEETRTFTCDLCPVTFRYSGAAAAHVRHAHGEAVDPEFRRREKRARICQACMREEAAGNGTVRYTMAGGYMR